MQPITIDATAQYGTKTNPILIVTNPRMDIYHNGFNGAWTPISTSGDFACVPFSETVSPNNNIPPTAVIHN